MTPIQTQPNAPRPPEYGAGALDYAEYLRVPELLKLQTPRSKPPHHDEMLFIIIHQAYELWFKLLIHEIETTIGYLKEGNLPRARHFAARIVEVMRLLVRQIHLLETMQPIEFLAFRDHLKPASGFQSRQFRELEFLLGLKEPKYLRFFEAAPEARARLERRLREPDLGSAFLDAVRNKGYAVPSADDADFVAKAAEALRPIYEKPEADPSLYNVCERLLEIDEVFHLWRQHHVGVVERMIGTKVGTGGSSGVSYLKTTTEKRSFPYLWEIRTRLGEPAGR